MFFLIFFLILPQISEIMVSLPADFVAETRRIMGEERFNRFVGAFEEEAPTSIRVNTRILYDGLRVMGDGGNQVPWCAEGYYLEDRPQFTFDPLLHAGCYYVQEASSMFVTHVVRTSLSPLTPKLALDLCAAPGGKSTALRSVLPEACVLVSNEPLSNRAQILLENITKWGAPNCIVTNNYPRDFRKSKLKFDLILCDVPCSGEGMMRKDPGAISEWSLKNVEKCWQLQREIVADGVHLIQKRTRRTSSGCLRTSMLRCSTFLSTHHGRLQARCSKVSTPPFIVSSPASPVAKACLSALCARIRGRTKEEGRRRLVLQISSKTRT